MKVAILGSGGREHAIAWRIIKDSESHEVYVIPGNAGMSLSSSIQCLDWDHNFDKLEILLTSNEIEFVIVGPETLLELGVVDFVEGLGIPCLGPNTFATQFESSKSFSKEFMNRFEIPTAKSVTITDYPEGIEAIDSWPDTNPPVVKASGLAAGKGVFVSSSTEQAKVDLYNIMENHSFPVSDSEVLLEERLTGREVSSFALFDGASYKVLGHSSDYKRLLDNDLGPNTGGMGTVCNKDWPTKSLVDKINEEVFKRFLDGLNNDGIQFKGILFAGLMISDNDEIKVIEFNVRFGDPETQALLPCIEGDFLSNLFHAAKGELNKATPLKLSGSCVHIVLTTKGYPFLNGEIPYYNQSIPNLSLLNDQHIFYAGVSCISGGLVNSGGRVLGISSKSQSINNARQSAYETIPLLTFNGATWRTDIGI